nr:hypothetical protein [Tanacetum cinerariifolium]
MTMTQQRDYMRDFVKNDSASVYNQGWTMKKDLAGIPGAPSVPADASLPAASLSDPAAIPVPAVSIAHAAVSVSAEPMVHSAASHMDDPLTAPEHGSSEPTVAAPTPDSNSDDDLLPYAPYAGCLLMIRMLFIFGVLRTAGAFIAGNLERMLKHGLEVSKLLVRGFSCWFSTTLQMVFSSPWFTAKKELTRHEGTALAMHPIELSNRMNVLTRSLVSHDTKMDVRYISLANSTNKLQEKVKFKRKQVAKLWSELSDLKDTYRKAHDKCHGCDKENKEFQMSNHSLSNEVKSLRDKLVKVETVAATSTDELTHTDSKLFDQAISRRKLQNKGCFPVMSLMLFFFRILSVGLSLNKPLAVVVRPSIKFLFLVKVSEADENTLAEFLAFPPEGLDLAGAPLHFPLVPLSCSVGGHSYFTGMAALVPYAKLNEVSPLLVFGIVL